MLFTDGGEQLRGARPGQFVMLRPDWAHDPLLPRAFSILDVEGERASYLVKVSGRGTALLESLTAGDRLSVLGPLGRPFPLGGSSDVLVAGGVGLAPLLWYARRNPGAHTVVYGARSAGDLVLLDEIRASGVRLVVATEDGSAPEGERAVKGRVTDALVNVLADVAPTSRVLACGPNAMMRAVADLAAARALECLLSLEGPMACGVGVCLGCPVENGPGAPSAKKAWSYCCVDGPVFDARTIILPA